LKTAPCGRRRGEERTLCEKHEMESPCAALAIHQVNLIVERETDRIIILSIAYLPRQQRHITKITSLTNQRLIG
jgi:hypothetical protein